MNEQLEYVRDKFLDEDVDRAKLIGEHWPKLLITVAEVRKINERRTTALLNKLTLTEANFQKVLETLIRCRHITNSDRVRQLLDKYVGGWRSK